MSPCTFSSGKRNRQDGRMDVQIRQMTVAIPYVAVGTAHAVGADIPGDRTLHVISCRIM